MLDILKFLLDFTIKFISKLFTINVGFTSLGVVFCIVNILLPIMLVLINSLKHQIVSSVNDDFENYSRRSKK